MKKDITALFCFVDTFVQAAQSYIHANQLEERSRRKPTRTCSMTLSEILTVLLMYHQSGCKNFEYFYKLYMPLYLGEFRCLLSYTRFIEIKSRALPYLIGLLQWYFTQSTPTGIAYIDSTSLAVCHNKRTPMHKVFRAVAALGKSSKGWFFGLKLHLVINEQGELMNLKFTRGNTDDRTPVPELTEHLQGLLFGDKGYIQQTLTESLITRGLRLITGIKKNMTPKLMSLFEKILLKKRSVIESVFDVLKNHFDLEHTRHRSIPNALVHLLSTLIAYCMKRNKPSITHSFRLV